MPDIGSPIIKYRVATGHIMSTGCTIHTRSVHLNRASVTVIVFNQTLDFVSFIHGELYLCQ